MLDLRPDRHVWFASGAVPIKRYQCGHCGEQVAPGCGFFCYDLDRINRNINLTLDQAVQKGSLSASIHLCSACGMPTVFDSGGKNQTPGGLSGASVEHVPEDVDALYDEARRCLPVGAPTAAVVSCRKILMHLAVEKGAKESAKFVEFVEHLSTTGWVPPTGSAVLERIRKEGNEANHEIHISPEAGAKALLYLVEMLLRWMYQVPSLMANGQSAEEKEGPPNAPPSLS